MVKDLGRGFNLFCIIKITEIVPSSCDLEASPTDPKHSVPFDPLAGQVAYRKLPGEVAAWQHSPPSQEGCRDLQKGHPSVTKGASPSAKHSSKVPFTKA